LRKRDRDGRGDHAQQKRGVGGDPAQHLARHDALVEGRAHPDHPVEDGLADIGHHPLAQPRHEVEAQRRAAGEDDGDHQKRKEILVQKLGAGGFEPVDHPAHGQGDGQRHDRRQNQRAEGCGQHRLVGRQKRPERAQASDPARFLTLLGRRTARRGFHLSRRLLGRSCHVVRVSSPATIGVAAGLRADKTDRMSRGSGKGFGAGGGNRTRFISLEG
jgi:hypothetical protein